VLGYLADRSLPADQLDRVRVPAGLDLGHITHQEIAVAILAELVQLRASGALAAAAVAAPASATTAPASATTAPASATTAPASATTAPASAGTATTTNAPAAAGPAPPATAVDPVCGMTVPATAASHPLAHDGVTYYFCSTNCRRRFEQDPAAHAPKETRC
jgi:xanthine dehydrogenase accessory factor